MKIIETSLRRPATVIICTLSLVFFGIMAYRQMGMQDMPDTDFPVVTVTTTMTGASATVMDNDVTDVIEEQLNTISGISSMNSSSYEGKAVTTVEFNLDRDIDAAAADVRDKVNAAQDDLPDDADTPIVEKFDASDSDIVQIAITGSASYKEKVHYVDKILKVKLQAVDGVGDIDTPGMRDREIRIWVDPVKLRSRGLVIEDISDAVNDKHVELPAGSMLIGHYDMDIRVKGEYTSVDALKDLPITTKDGVVIRLGDIADIEDGFEDVSNVALYNGDDTIIVGIKKQRGANDVKVCDDVIYYLKRAEKSLPDGIEMHLLYNDANFIRRSISGVTGDVFKAVLLCSLLMLFFLQTIRATFVTIVNIPVCLIGSFILMKAMGITINNQSMMGISLAVGMVVDATTVVLENVDRHMNQGLLPYDAALTGTKEVSFAVIGGAITTIAVFSPIAFMSGMIGRLFFAFGVTVMLTIAISLVLSMTLAPFLCSRILKKTEPGRFALLCSAMLTNLENGYRRALNAAVHHRAVTMLIAISLFIGGMFLAGQVGTAFMANNDEGTFMIKCELPSGTAIEESTRVMKEIGGVVRKYPAVQYTYAEIGSGTGSESNKGTLYIQLVSRKQRKNINSVMQDVRRRTSQFRDVTMTFTTFAGKDLEMVLVGGSTKQLIDISDKMIEDAEKTGKVTDVETDVRLDKPQLAVELNRGLTDDMNMDIRTMTDEIEAYFGGTDVGVFKEDGYRYDITVMAREDKRSDLTDIDNIYFKDGNGDIVQAPGLFSVKEVMAPNVVKRYGRQRSLTISANVTTDFSTGQAVTLFNELADKYIPKNSGISLVSSGMTKNQQDDFKRLGTALIVAIALVYVVMVIQFESFLHPFAVMFSLPLLTPGAFGLLYLTNCKLDMMSYMGIILLVGIVVNNGIILVDFIKQQRDSGVEKIQAVVNAGPLRLRPILITALSTMMGALPTALKLSEGSESRQSMSVAVFGGLFTSTLLTLLVVPVVYLILDDLKERVTSFMAKRRKDATEGKIKIQPGREA